MKADLGPPFILQGDPLRKTNGGFGGAHRGDFRAYEHPFWVVGNLQILRE